MIGAPKRFATFGVAFVSATALAACSGSGTASTGDTTVSGNVEDAVKNDFGGQSVKGSNAADGGTFTWAMAAPVPHLDPSKAIGASLVGPMAAIYEPLMTMDPKGNAQPMLAESFTSEDQKTWTLTLPTGLKFTDGTSFNAEAVVAHVKNIASETSESKEAYQARLITDMRTKGEDVVIFELQEEWAQFPGIFADITSLAMVPSPTAVEKYGAQFGLHPVGVGPYKVKDFKPGQSLTLIKNEDYRVEGEPRLDTIKYVTLSEAAAQISGMQTGEIDGAALRTPAAIHSAKEAGLRVLTQPSYNYYSVYLNHGDPDLKDPTLRRALSMAVDRKGINQAVFSGAVNEMEGFLSTDHPYHENADNWPGYNEVKAKELIDAYKNETGQSTIKLKMTLPGIPEMKRIAALLQQQWKKVGVDLSYNTANPSEMVSGGVSGEYEMQMRDAGIQPETLSRMTQNFYSGSPASIVGSAKEEFDSILEDATSNPEMREQAITDIQIVLNDWLPQIPLLTSISAVAVGDSVAVFPGTYPTTSAESVRTNHIAIKK